MRKCTIGSGRSRALSVLSVGLALLWSRGADAAGEGCTERDLDKAKAGPTREAWVASLQHWLGKCEGRLTQSELSSGLSALKNLYLDTPPDFDGCLRVTKQLLRLYPGVTGLVEDYGYCGGDCSESTVPVVCQRGKERQKQRLVHERYLDAEAKVGAEFEMDQPVPCALEAARKLVANMDRSAFYGLAMRFLSKYENECPEATDPTVRVSLANDKALVLFHKGEDAACLHALDEVASFTKDHPESAFNRALCGGSCSLDSARCAVAEEARNRALLARAKIRPVGTAHDGQVCRRGIFTRRPTRAFAWDLKSYRECQEGKCEPTEYPMTVLGDLDGDGSGEYSNRAIQTHEYQSRKDVYRERYLVFRLFSNIDVCERGAFVERAKLDTDNSWGLKHPLEYSAKVTAPANAAAKSFCIYPSKGLKCSATACNNKPYRCADLTQTSE